MLPEHEGMDIQEHMVQKCEEVLMHNGFDSNGVLLEGKESVPNQKHIEQAAIESAAIKLNIWNYNTLVFLETLLPCLWFGNVNGAISLLENIDTKNVKNRDIITF